MLDEAGTNAFYLEWEVGRESTYFRRSSFEWTEHYFPCKCPEWPDGWLVAWLNGFV